MKRPYIVDSNNLDSLRNESLEIVALLSQIARSLEDDPDPTTVQAAAATLRRRSKQFSRTVEWTFPRIDDMPPSDA